MYQKIILKKQHQKLKKLLNQIINYQHQKLKKTIKSSNILSKKKELLTYF